MTTPSVLTFIALADELNRVMSALQGIANGNVGDPMEYAVKTLEATKDAFNPTHQSLPSVLDMKPVEFIHKLSHGFLQVRESEEKDAPLVVQEVVVYRGDSGIVFCRPPRAFNMNFKPVTK